MPVGATRPSDRGASDDLGWDHENHLTSTDINGVSSTYDYNGDGLRMSRTIGAVTTDYVWDQARDLPVFPGHPLMPRLPARR